MSNFQIHELSTGALDRDSNLVHDTEVSTDVWNTRKATAGAVADLASANVAAAYASATTYAIGQYCLYEGDIYRCIAITTGSFDSTKWTQIVVTGEFRRVVELTSAQYTALSSAEKNNGTLYIITDEETTAADIPYSAGVSVADKLDNVPTFDTLTTGDNNKLLGVSVSGDDISVGAVAITGGTVTFDSTQPIEFSHATLIKFGNMAFLSYSVRFSANIAAGVAFATLPSGFRPKAQFNADCVMSTGSGLIPSNCRLDTDGKISQGQSNNCRQIQCSILYECV